MWQTLFWQPGIRRGHAGQTRRLVLPEIIPGVFVFTRMPLLLGKPLPENDTSRLGDDFWWYSVDISTRGACFSG
ncbi:MAG TPA: hypothetical protein PLO92_01955 [Anaerolineaceae bacterium]|nr:hypothetical protein [Anaerolineaceae bacterium]HOR84402.1 hypothetical protein [Anaerolineaceae bacterium]HPL43283.1 hypothetical protein [Anaerolineaceae bacterium]HPY32456.1 hypothetical protein [Anaerolineaceae bacterium]HQC20576.1 hypothetical protein [Anaerolineaceae bacterium]